MIEIVDIHEVFAPDKKKLDAFLVDNQELELLNARLSSFNIFNVLRIARAEIRHSNVLAWLLTPGESHGLGDWFLRRLFSRLLMENEVDTKLTAADVELMRLEDVEVLREWNHIDIVVRSPRGRWCLLIENKIHSCEGMKQLVRYRERAREEMPEWDIVPVFLTLQGDEPSQEGLGAGYVALSHTEVFKLADILVQQHRSRIPQDALVFLDHYLTTLRRLTMQDEQLVDLCKRIYRKHREAIEMIVEYGTASQLTDNALKAVEALIPSAYVTTHGGWVWFLPTQIAALVPEVQMVAWDFLPKRYPIACWVECLERQNRIRCALEVGPIADSETRIRLLKCLQEAGFSFQKKALRPDARFTRLISVAKSLDHTADSDPAEDYEHVKSVVQHLWKKVWSEGQKILPVLEQFQWPQCVHNGSHGSGE